MGFVPKKKKGASAEEGPGEDLEDMDTEDSDIDAFIARRRKHVEKQIKQKAKGYTLDGTKIAAVADARRAVVKQLLAILKGTPKCHQCQA